MAVVSGRCLSQGPRLRFPSKISWASALSETSPGRIDGDVPFAAHDLFGTIVSALLGEGRLDRSPSSTPPGPASRLTCSQSGCSRSNMSATSWIVPNSNWRTMRRDHQYTVCQGPSLLGSMRQPPALPAMYWIALRISRKLTAGLRPRGGGLRRCGAIQSHSASVKSDGYRLVLRAKSANPPRLSRVNIPSLNHNPTRCHNGSQTVTET